MNQRLTKRASVHGIPLSQTNPASVEKFLIEQVRADLGQYKDLAIIKPMLRVDSKDADLSGNISNGFGAVELDVRGVKVYLPFIIHNKELLPFDVIRLGDQEVSYDPSKLRQVVNGIDKKVRDEGERSSDAFSIGDLADPKNVPTGNGFLGNIMQIRDEESARGLSGGLPWEGPDFGSIDDDRLTSYASANVDILEVFNDAMERLASVKVIPAAAVKDYVEHIEKQAAEESQKQIDAVSGVQQDSMEAAGVRRGMAKLKDEKLVDVSRVASGNNIKFPVADQGTFEYRNGRVYHKVEPWAVSDKERVVAPIKSIVVDSKGGYKFLMRDSDKFMTTLENPPLFNLAIEKCRGLTPDRMYVTEFEEDTLSHPFVVQYTYNTQNHAHSFGMISSSDYPEAQTTNSLFTDRIDCREVMPAKEKDYDYIANRSFAILVARDQLFEGMKRVSRDELQALIQEKAKDPMDAKLASWMAGHDNDTYVVSQDHEFIRLEHAIQDYFTRPDGYFKEGPLVKQAAYDGLNKVSLVVEKDKLPRTYAIQWQYSDSPQGGGDHTGAVQLQRRQLPGLSEDKAREMLGQLGFDNRKTEMFFEIAKRNGRQASFDMPDVEKAKLLAPQDVGAQKAQKVAKAIGNSTLNANNFMPILEDVMAEGLSGFLGHAAPQTTDWSRKLDGWFKTSFETAVEIEKVATQLGGATWYELAAMTNLKHNLDKTASAVLRGDYLIGMESVFEKVAELAPVISEHMGNLIMFNRQQLTKLAKPAVAPRLVKQALHELDGLYRYATARQPVEDMPKAEKQEEKQESGAATGGLAGLARGKTSEKEAADGDLMQRLQKTAAENLPGKP